MPMSKSKQNFWGGIAWYYGENDFILQTFHFIACLDSALVTSSIDTDSHMNCSEKYAYL